MRFIYHSLVINDLLSIISILLFLFAVIIFLLGTILYFVRHWQRYSYIYAETFFIYLISFVLIYWLTRTTKDNLYLTQAVLPLANRLQRYLRMNLPQPRFYDIVIRKQWKVLEIDCLSIQ